MQNHYLTRGCASPMVFVGRRFWTEEVPVYPLLARLVATGRYRNLALSLVEGVDGEHVGFAHLVGYRFVLFRHSCMLVCCAAACAMGEERSRQTGWMCILLILLIFVKLQRNDTTRRILP